MGNGGKGGFNWLMGCGIGCVVIIALMVILGLIGYGLGKRFYDDINTAVREDFIDMFHTEYETYVEEGKIPEEHQDLVGGLVALSEQEDIGFFAILMCGGSVLSSLEDGELDEDEVKILEDVKAFLDKDPSPSMIEIGVFMDSHPEIEKVFKEMQNRHQEFNIELEGTLEPVPE